MHTPLRYSIMLCMLTIIAGCSTSQTTHQVSGTVSFAQPVTPQPNWRLEVKLLDISHADAPSITLGKYENDTLDTIPVRYAISYHPARIDPRFTYSVSAAIYDTGNPNKPRLLLRTTQANLVLTRGHSAQADVVLESIR